jgi:excisionase family DNA binding protein
MAQRPKDDETTPATPAHRFPKFLTIDQVAEILNVNKPTIYTLLRSGEMKGLRLGGRGVWRISEDDLQAFLDAAYQETAEWMAAGDDDDVPAAEGEASP